MTLGGFELGHTVNIINSIHTGTCSAANLTTTGTLANSFQFTCTGTETHSGAETHNGSVTFAGSSFKLLGRDKGSTQQYGFYADNMTVADGGHSAYHLSTVYVGNILNLIVKPEDKLGATVTVKNEYTSTQNILVKTDAGALTLASITPELPVRSVCSTWAQGLWAGVSPRRMPGRPQSTQQPGASLRT